MIPSFEWMPADDAPIWRIWLSAFQAPALAVADEIGLFAALGTQPASTSELAARLEVEPRAAEVLATLMAALDLLMKADGRYHLTPTARTYLLPESPYYWGGMLRRIRDAPLDCARLLRSLRRGSSDADAAMVQLWNEPDQSGERLRGFTAAMHCHSLALATRVVPLLGLERVGRLLDVAGGSGAFSIVAAARVPVLRCTVLDLPSICEVATGYIAQLGMSARVEVAPRDMFADAWPTGFDRVFFNDIFHDWGNERCRELAARARAALVPAGRVLVHEMLLSDGKDFCRSANYVCPKMGRTIEGGQDDES